MSSGNVRFYDNTETASTITEVELFDVQIMRAGATQFEAAKMQHEELRMSINEYKKFAYTIAEADVRTLNTLNGGLGIELLPAIDGDTTYDIVNPVIIQDISDIGFSKDDTLHLYYEGSGASLYQLDVTSALVVPKKFGQYPDIIAGSKATLNHSEGFYVWLGKLHAGFQGSIRIEFEYRELNLTL